MDYALSHHCSRRSLSKVADRKKRAPIAPWTATRCNRLLRTITSRIVVLRRLRKLKDEIKWTALSPQEPSSADSSASSPDCEHEASCPDSPEWLPRCHTRAPNKTYAGRVKVSRLRKDKSQTRTGDLVFSTPLVKKIMRPEQCSPVALTAPSPFPGVAINQKRSFARLPAMPLSGPEEAHRSLATAFETFLSSTRPPEAPSRTGTASLMDTCLRQVAHYIELEEASFASSQNEHCQSSDAAFELYTELETLGTRAGGGWKGLRQVIRTRGIRQIELAIDDGLLPESLVDKLLDICIRNAAFQESQVIMEAYARLRGVDAQAFCFKIAKACFEQGASAYWLRIVATMLTTGRMSPHRLSQKAQRALWQTFLRVLMESDCTAATDFVSAWVAGLKNLDASDNSSATTTRLLRSLVDVLAMLTAMVLTSEASTAHRNISRLLYDVTTTHDFDDSSIGLNSVMLTIVLILRCTDCQAQSTMRELSIVALLETLHQIRETPSGRRTTPCAIVEFICNIVKIVDRIEIRSGTALLQDILSSIFRKTSTETTRATKKTLEKLAYDCAARHAEISGDMDILEAMQDQDLFAAPESSDRVCKTPERRQPRQTYRWEDGLSEWIAATPVTCIASNGIGESDCVSNTEDDIIERLNEYNFSRISRQTLDPFDATSMARMGEDQTSLHRTVMPHRQEANPSKSVLAANLECCSPTGRKPLVDMGISARNCMQSPTAAVRAKALQKDRSVIKDDAIPTRHRQSEVGSTYGLVSVEEDGDQDELALLSPRRIVPVLNPRKRIKREDIERGRKRRGRGLGMARRLLSSVTPSWDVDNTSDDELAT